MGGPAAADFISGSAFRAQSSVRIELAWISSIRTFLSVPFAWNSREAKFALDFDEGALLERARPLAEFPRTMTPYAAPCESRKISPDSRPFQFVFVAAENFADHIRGSGAHRQN